MEQVFYCFWHVLRIQGNTTYTQQSKEIPSPKAQSPLGILQLALPPTAGLHPSVTGKMLRALREDSKHALRIFSALLLILLNPMNIKASDSQSSGFVCAVALIHFQTMFFDFSLQKPPENKLKGWQAVRYPASAFVLRYTGPACKPAKFRPHPFISAHLPGIAYISHMRNTANFLQIASMQIPFKHTHPLCVTNDNAWV